MNYLKLSDIWTGKIIEPFDYESENLLTVIITASFIPSHPSIDLIKKVIESLRIINLPRNTEIILAHDYGNHEDYENYFLNLHNYIKNYNNIKIIRRNTRGYLIGNIENAIKHVKTKYMLVCQHDLAFRLGFDVNKIVEDMIENPKIKHALFNIMVNLPHAPKHEFHTNKNGFYTEIMQKNYKYIQTHSWSDQNHVCLKSYYTDFVLPECKKALEEDILKNDKPTGGCGAMEVYLNKRVETLDEHEEHGTYIIGPIGTMPSIIHLNGRNYNGDRVSRHWDWDND